MAAPARRTRRTARDRRRGVDLLEFMFVLPFLLFFLLFTFDVGRMSLISGMLHDAANAASRAGAQAGGGCINISARTTSATCSEANSRTVSSIAFREGLSDRPLVTPLLGKFRVTEGGVCRVGGPTYVVVQATYDAPLTAPGLRTLLNLSVPGGPWTLRATAVSRCEIVR